MCLCLCIYFHIPLPHSVNFRISWNNFLNCFAPQSVFSVLSFIYAPFVNSHHWKKSLNVPLYTSEASFVFFFPDVFSYASFCQQFICVCCPFFFFWTKSSSSLQILVDSLFPFSQNCRELHLLWYKQTQQFLSLLLLSLLSVMTYRAPTWLISP